MARVNCDKTPALAFFEFTSIARGLFLTDVAVKKAPVHVVASQPISSGKYVLLFFGEVASVNESFCAVSDACLGEYSHALIRKIFIPGVHPDLVDFLDQSPNCFGNNTGFGRAPTGLESIAVIESMSLAGAILSADFALKAARVNLSRMRLGQGIGGKAYYVLTGEQSDVEAAREAAVQALQDLESYVGSESIPNPQPDGLEFY